MKMCYWDYRNIVRTANYNNRKAAGLPVVKPIRRSNKDMIKRAKDLDGTK